MARISDAFIVIAMPLGDNPSQASQYEKDEPRRLRSIPATAQKASAMSRA